MPIAEHAPSPASTRISSTEIWRMTWPQLLMMLCQFMIGFTDVWVAGRIDSDVQAALGLVTQCLFFVMVVGISIANASVASMSQSLGAGEPLRAKRYLGMVILLGMAACIITVGAGYTFRTGLLTLLKVPQEIFPLTRELWTIFLFTLPAQFASLFCSAAFRAHKNVKIPLYTAIIVFVVNGIMDFALGLGYLGLPKMGASGLALATFLSTLAGAIFNLYMLHRIGYLSRESFTSFSWYKTAIGKFLKIALPAGGMQFNWQLGYMVLMGITASLPFDSVNSVAGMTTGMRIESILFLPAMAFSMTGSVLVGHSLGAGNKAEAKRVGLKVLFFSTSSMSIVALVMWPFVASIAAFMSPASEAVQIIAVHYIEYNLFSTPFTIGSMVLGGILTGAGATIYPFFVYSGATWLIRLPLAYFLGHIYWQNASGIFVSMLCSQVVQCSVIFYIFLRCDWARFAMFTKPARTVMTEDHIEAPDKEDHDS